MKSIGFDLFLNGYGEDVKTLYPRLLARRKFLFAGWVITALLVSLYAYLSYRGIDIYASLVMALLKCDLFCVFALAIYCRMESLELRANLYRTHILNKCLAAKESEDILVSGVSCLHIHSAFQIKTLKGGFFSFLCRESVIFPAASGESKKYNGLIMASRSSSDADDAFKFFSMDEILNDVMGRKRIFHGMSLKDAVFLLGYESLTSITPACKHGYEVDMLYLHQNPMAIEKYQGNDDAMKYWLALFTGSLPGSQDYGQDDVARGALCAIQDYSPKKERKEFFINELLPRGVEKWGSELRSELISNFNLYVPSFIFAEMISIAEREKDQFKRSIAIILNLKTHGAFAPSLNAIIYDGDMASRGLLSTYCSPGDSHRALSGSPLVSQGFIDDLAKRMLDLLGFNPADCKEPEKLGYQALYGTPQALKMFPNDKRLFLSSDMDL